MNNSFTIDDLKAVIERFHVELIHLRYGFREGYERRGCILSMVLLHRTQSIIASWRPYLNAIDRGITVPEYVAENTVMNLSYLKGLELGFEIPTINKSPGDEQFQLGRQHGIIIGNYLDERSES